MCQINGQLTGDDGLSPSGTLELPAKHRHVSMESGFLATVRPGSPNFVP